MQLSQFLYGLVVSTIRKTCFTKFKICAGGGLEDSIVTYQYLKTLLFVFLCKICIVFL